MDLKVYSFLRSLENPYTEKKISYSFPQQAIVNLIILASVKKGLRVCNLISARNII